jgi:hypothetical protein
VQAVARLIERAADRFDRGIAGARTIASPRAASAIAF